MRWIVLSVISMLLVAPVLNGATYVVGYGDTLWDLSIHYYGTPDYWEDILYANEHVVDQYHLMPGQVLLIPGIASTSVYATDTFSNMFGYYNASAEPLLSRLQLETAGSVATEPTASLGYVLITNVEEVDDYYRDNAIHGDLIEISLGVKESVFLQRVGENVGVVVTNRRALGLSPFAGGFNEIALGLKERIESVNTNANLATVVTDRRILIYRSPSGSWAERRLDLK